MGTELVPVSVTSETWPLLKVDVRVMVKGASDVETRALVRTTVLEGPSSDGVDCGWFPALERTVGVPGLRVEAGGGACEEGWGAFEVWGGGLEVGGFDDGRGVGVAGGADDAGGSFVGDALPVPDACLLDVSKESRAQVVVALTSSRRGECTRRRHRG